MKPKKLSKRLVLNRETVANLVNKEMVAAIGGIDTITCIMVISQCIVCQYTHQETCRHSTLLITNEPTCICWRQRQRLFTEIQKEVDHTDTFLPEKF